MSIARIPDNGFGYYLPARYTFGAESTSQVGVITGATLNLLRSLSMINDKSLSYMADIRLPLSHSYPGKMIVRHEPKAVLSRNVNWKIAYEYDAKLKEQSGYMAEYELIHAFLGVFLENTGDNGTDVIFPMGDIREKPFI